ncbi:MAG: hypothetical protein PUA84_02955 [Oscillospiraceae bacterium]|nr:hypothetical protein [Oscillospiraceae bacterium]
MNKIYRLHMGKAKCAVDLGDGSERGEYVSQDYILSRLGRPHRSISLMYCYYPLDEGWPGRASVVHASPEVRHAWGYPYDDYFPYEGGLNGSTEGEPFRFMRDIRSHGQDVTLTLTIDPNVPDEHIAAIARDLRPFGRVFLRINHEATGTWFSFNKRCTYQEVADFFVRANRIIKEIAPNVQTIICIGGIEDPESAEMVKEKEFAQTIPEADIWSVDKYFALHYGWPFDIAEPGGGSYYRHKIRDIYDLTKKSFERFLYLNGGVQKPMVMSELNADGDVTGPYEQAQMVREFCDILEEDNADWFTGFTFYQFRDRGRLGLETEDPNNPEVGIPQPVMETYKEIISRERHLPVMTQGEEIQLPVTLRWGNSEDADGIAIPLHFEKNPVFCEIYFEDDSNLIMEINGRWFYKAPGTKYIDLMSAFYEKPLPGETDLTLKIFAPPAGGENDLTIEDGLYNSYTEIKKIPSIRICFEPIEK